MSATPLLWVLVAIGGWNLANLYARFVMRDWATYHPQYLSFVLLGIWAAAILAT